MSLELLPNEILLDLFDYFDGVDLLHAFYGLNSRFNLLFYNQFLAYRFNFKSISKRTFDMFCQQHLPFIVDRVITLSLPDGKEAPEHINLFFSYVPSLSKFRQLRSLTIFNLRSYETTLKIIHKCHDLCNLTYLKLDFCFIPDNQADLQPIMNSIWNLPMLTHCDLGIFIKGWPSYFRIPTIISTSLKYVSISQCDLEWYQINQLCDCTPYITHLAISITSNEQRDYIPYCLPTLIALNIDIFSKTNISKMILFFQNIPNLRNLNISLWRSLITGQQWEQIIHNYLPKLKVFRLKMSSELHCSYSFPNMKVKVHELVNSFRSPFWIDEHQWFVRCFVQNHTIYLHTLSSTFKYHNIKLPYSWTSTYPNDDPQTFYDSIMRIYDENFFDQLIPSHIRLSNIQYLRVKLPINDRFWSIVPSLKRLDSLSILFHTDAFQSQVQAILDRAPHLRCLHIHQNLLLPLQTSLFKYTNASVRRLALRNCNHYFTVEECRRLSHSPLGIQCEVLSIMIKHRESIIYFIENIINLRVLIIRCEDDKNSEQLILTTNDDEKLQNENIRNEDEFIRWLKNHLPSTCSIIRDSDSADRIRICL